jgi:hypothetical protein
MPITTPAPMVEKYHDGKDHFHHVYHCLFEPSIRKAGYTPVPPKAEGSDVIHAGIVGNLESADLVLCDMSCLNPNVFFEWGIRTALNKPVCLVKDELTKDVPFDTTMLNYHPYSSTLHGWEIEAEREKLTSHLTASAAKGADENALWKYFGLSSKGQPYQGREGTDGKLDYITMQIESIAKRIGRADDRMYSADRGRSRIREDKSDRLSQAAVQDTILNVLPSGSGMDFRAWFSSTEDGSDETVFVRPDPSWDYVTKRDVAHVVQDSLGLAVTFVDEKLARLIENDRSRQDTGHSG